MTTRLMHPIALMCALAALICSAGCRGYTDPPSMPSGEATYVGSYACRECHPDEYTLWDGSLHAQVIQEPADSPTAILADFTSGTVDPDEGAVRPEFAPTDVRLVHGRQWKQRFVDEKWRILPQQWNLQQGQWAPHNPDTWEQSDWRRECAGCHTVGFDESDLTWTELGIGCESCHGPGSHHVIVRDELKQRTIVNPMDLTPLARGSICGQCHTRGQSPDGAFPHPVGYEPGLVLTEAHFTVVPWDDAERWWPTGHQRSHRQQYPEWRDTAHARAGVDCTSCHEPHGGKWGFLLHEPGSQVCIDCHAQIDTDPVVGHAPIADAPQHADCIGCHMPRVGKSVAMGDESSHKMAFIPPGATLELGSGDPDRQPNSCNSCHYHSEDGPAGLQAALDKAVPELPQDVDATP